MARHPAYLSLVCWSYRQAADSGDVVIQKRCIAIVDTRAPVSATPFLFLLRMDRHRHVHES